MGTVLSDIWLLENLLHFFIIEELYNLAFASHSNYHSFPQLTYILFFEFEFLILRKKKKNQLYSIFKDSISKSG
jgi:hypothetical protein